MKCVLLVLLCCIAFSAGAQSTETDTLFSDQRAIKALYFKKKMSFRNSLLRMKYAVNKYSLVNDTSLSKKGWAMTFHDEFDSLDKAKWRLGQPWGEIHPANLHQYYSDQEIRTEGGYLYLGASYKPKMIKFRDSQITVPYAIGLINSDISFKQKYGYFEIRSKNPGGPATWPAFWLTGATRWPPEIDIFEMYGGKTGKTIHRQCVTIHWGKNDTRSRGFLTRGINLPNNTDTVFHVYGCEWSPDFIRFYTDGHLVSYIRINARVRKWMDEEMVIIINNCFEQRYLKYLPADFSGNQFVVDWVRVYRRQ